MNLRFHKLFVFCVHTAQLLAGFNETIRNLKWHWLRFVRIVHKMQNNKQNDFGIRSRDCCPMPRVHNNWHAIELRVVFIVLSCRTFLFAQLGQFPIEDLWSPHCYLGKILPNENRRLECSLAVFRAKGFAVCAFVSSLLTRYRFKCRNVCDQEYGQWNDKHKY